MKEFEKYLIMKWELQQKHLPVSGPNENIKNYLKNDYMIIDKMYEYGWINDNQYKYLKL